MIFEISKYGLGWFLTSILLFAFTSALAQTSLPSEYPYFPFTPIDKPLPNTDFTNTQQHEKNTIELLVDAGYAVLAYDLIGYGTRMAEFKPFYSRYPNSTLMGQMVNELEQAVVMAQNLENIDGNQIIVAGEGLGADVAIFHAALFNNHKTVVVNPNFPYQNASPATINYVAVLNKWLPNLEPNIYSTQNIDLDTEGTLLLASAKNRLIIDTSPNHLFRSGKLVQHHVAQINRAKQISKIEYEQLNLFNQNNKSEFINLIIKP